MEQPICSVVMPTRDCLEYLKRSIPSIYEQDIEGIEIIVVDDGSTDGSDKFLAQCAQKDKNFIVLQSSGIGPGRARNLAIGQAKARYIAFLDADDLWPKGKLARQLHFHKCYPDAGFSFSNYSFVTPDETIPMTCFEYWGLEYLSRRQKGYEVMSSAESLLLRHNIVGTSAVVAKREYLQNANGFATNLQSATDWDMWLKLAKMAPVGVSPEVGMHYLMRPGSITKNRQDRIDAMIEIVDRYRLRDEPEIKKAVRMADANIAVARAEFDHECGRNWHAIRHYLDAIIKKPSKRSLWAASHSVADGVKNSLGLNKAA